jgi:hypothetical protein
MRSSFILFATLAVCCGSNAAEAHFLFARICPAAEGGRVAEVYFSEYAHAGDPRYIAKMAGGTYWLQTTAGEFRPLEMKALSDRLRGRLPVEGSLMVVGQLDYGVLGGSPGPAFLLRHYSKAVAGKSDEINRLAAKGTNVEIVATFEPDRVVMTALLGGKPMPNTLFTTVDVNLSNEEIKGDADGRASFTPPASGVYTVYVRHTDPSSGEHRDKSYKEIREFATLTFSWPLAATGADPEAVEMFEEALAARAVWKDFPGFTAKISGDIEERPFDGTVAVAADGGVTLELVDDDAVQGWVREQLESITMHRAASQHAGSEREKPIVRFADDQADHPLGRLLAFEGGHFATSYRIKDKQITSVNRVIDGKNMTITVLDNEKNAEGAILPRSYTVQYWDGATGKPERSETVQARWARVGNFDLPARHTVTAANENGFSVRSFELREHKLTTPAGK